MRTYYIDRESGRDTNEGISETRPWRSIDRVNRTVFRPGDRILFAGGQTFAGTIRLDSNGTIGQKVVVASCGEERAVIDGGNGGGLVADGCMHIVVKDLHFLGSGRKDRNTADGIRLLNTSDVTVTQVEVSGFRGSGIATLGDKKSCITHVYAHDNGFAGISVESGQQGLTEDLYIAYCIAENNPGDPSVKDNHSGNGIVVGGVKRGTIEFCEAMNNGWDMPRQGNGPVGIWAWHSDQVVIQHCISHHNKSPGLDGGGFDFDGGMTNSIMRYNLSYCNAGAGYGLFQFVGAHTWKDNTVRYNISIDDGYKNSQSGIHVWAGSENMSHAEIYNNTIINRTGHAVGYLTDVPCLNFRNNLFITGFTPIHGPYSESRYVQNLYWCLRGFDMDGCRSLEDWSLATGQEKMGERIAGLYADPKLIMPDPEAEVLTEPMSPQTLQLCMLQAGSPCIGAALPIPDNGGHDFWGNRIPEGEPSSIGAHERGKPKRI
jgi:hypothetical protein